MRCRVARSGKRQGKDVIGNESAGDLSMNMHVISDLLYLIYQIALPHVPPSTNATSSLHQENLSQGLDVDGKTHPRDLKTRLRSERRGSRSQSKADGRDVATFG